MKNAVATAKAKAMELMPNKEELIDAGKRTGGVLAGIIASHAVVKSVEAINKPVGHGVILAGGFYGACKVKDPFLQALCVGAAVYGGFRLLGAAAAAVTEPAATSGLAGILPEKVKEALRKYIPTFAGIEEVAGLGDAGDGDNEFSGNLSLDDVGRGAGELSDYEEVAGLGNSDIRLAA
jgi:hypothetical protein